MSELGDLLELLLTSDRRWRTFRATGREWRHTQRLLTAFEREARKRTAVMTYGGRAEGRDPAEQDERWALWIAPQAMVRAEFAVGDETITAVLDGYRWWRWSPSDGARTNAANPQDQSSHGTGPGAALLETASILPGLSFEITGRVEFAGRSAVAVRATPLHSERDQYFPSGLHGIGSADEYELLVDAERGVVLRAEARLDGSPFKVVDVTEVAFDEDFPPDTFVLELPPGETFESPPDFRDVPLDRMESEVPFTVLVPEHPPIGSGPGEPLETPERGMIMPAAPRWNMPAHAHISYHLV